MITGNISAERLSATRCLAYSNIDSFLHLIKKRDGLIISDRFI